MQFEQADFQRQRLLHVGVQQPLGLLQGLQILQRLPRGDAPGDGVRAGNFGELQQTVCPPPGCAATRRAATIARAEAPRPAGGDIPPRWPRPVHPPIFRAGLFRLRRTVATASGRSGILPPAPGFRRVVAAAHRAAGSGRAGFFAHGPPGRQTGRAIPSAPDPGDGCHRRKNSDAGSATGSFPKAAAVRSKAKSTPIWPAVPRGSSKRHWPPGHSTGPPPR